MEIEVPKEVLPILPKEAKETILGDKRGAKKQYRYGNLHIREYDDKYTIHIDRVDPRKDPIGHLIYDAPEVLVGLFIAFIFGYSSFRNNSLNIIPNFLLSSIFGYIGYRTVRYVKEKAL